MILLSEIYDVTLKRGNRGAARAGWVRPTIGETYMTHKDFQELASFNLMLPETTGFLNSLYVYDGKTTTKTSVNLIPRGKWYFEQKVLLREDNGANTVSFLDENYVLLASATGAMNIYTRDASFACGNGTVMGIRLDVDAGTIGIYKNNSYVTSKSWTPGTAIRLRAVSWANGGSNKMNCQVNAGPNLTYAVPDGYSPLPYEFNL